jgi:apolipoprotein N-acyltransferase
MLWAEIALLSTAFQAQRFLPCPQRLTLNAQRPNFEVQRTVAQPIITEAAEKPQLPRETPHAGARPAGLRLALLSGLLLWLACPPANLWPLAWVALAPLMVSITRASRLRQAVWRGYLFGWAFLGPVWYWVGLTIVGWTGGSPIGWIAWFLLTLILAAFQGAWGGIAWWISRRAGGGWRLVGFAAAWVVMEWARTLGSLGMPWAQLSYTQYRFLPIVQFADTTGAYGVSFLLMLMNGAVAHWWLSRGTAGSTRWLRVTAALAGVAVLYGAVRLLQHDSGPPITVAAMQNGIDSFHVPPAEAQIQVIADQTALAARDLPTPQLYVWAESAVPGDILHDPILYTFLRNMARERHAAVATGGRIGSRNSGDAYNSSLVFPPDGSRAGRYDKQQLVPFGEFIPMRDVLTPLVGGTFDFPTDDVIPGTHPKVLRYNDPNVGPVALGPFICYEAMYPPYARRMANEGADLLVTQSNDSWFQSGAAMEQHLSAVTLRAIENRKEIVRATTTGITCLMDAEGRVMKRAPLYRPGYVIGTMHRMTARTLYTRLGDWFVALSAALVVAAIWPRGAKREA